ncbi:hypothetical protein A2642_03005 [Candidatus Nomurabacteria bacterium RIFCSPHIGHO2_01_FULL_39_10]|uniref:Uncharacterized protein n=1 Tax=Candidatus Nomurabacteria bacterium RIFCSPHIGHO2_01_FULL_39_10 TaxID=1801733 RepID=A0A1F6V6R0_9BACT|nr:MAG: hypothetical protein A2642_03005 [Candidatus Nomurabacteria bacterium RIFCSPHIGHO2_01_FULL_39_10]
MTQTLKDNLSHISAEILYTKQSIKDTWQHIVLNNYDIQNIILLLQENEQRLKKTDAKLQAIIITLNNQEFSTEKESN